MNTGLDGRTVVVAGAGGGGIGTAICRSLAEEGAVVAALDRDADNLAISERAIVDAGGRHHSILLDLRDAAQVDAAVAEAVDATGDLYGLVVVAGGLLREYWAPLTDVSPESFDDVIRLNLTAAFYATQSVGRRLRDRGDGGSIVHIESIAAIQAMPFGVAYSAAKAALGAVTRTAALELGPADVRVNAIACGSVRTPRAARDAPPEDPPGDRAVIPLRRRGLPVDIANSVVFLLSQQAAWITGQVMVVDGGASVLPAYLDEDLLPVFVHDDAFRSRLLS